MMKKLKKIFGLKQYIPSGPPKRNPSMPPAHRSEVVFASSSNSTSFPLDINPNGIVEYMNAPASPGFVSGGGGDYGGGGASGSWGDTPSDSSSSDSGSD